MVDGDEPSRSVSLAVGFGTRLVTETVTRDLSGAFRRSRHLGGIDRQRVDRKRGQARLPTMYVYREHVVAGGLMAYAPDLADLFRRAAGYVNQILKGATPPRSRSSNRIGSRWRSTCTFPLWLGAKLAARVVFEI